ncbi:Tify domain binding domain [Dillenia turbinata]|uniref:Tify domain binding domain n=1 Tax=Dillenia turbinata TaxID=194707 RepID=A0AAN8Z954_9MAGN
MSKSPAALTDGDSIFNNSSRIGPKRSHEWFVDAMGSELYPNKKQSIQAPTNKSNQELSNSGLPSWESASGFQSISNQFIDRLFGAEMTRHSNFSERGATTVGQDDSDIRKGITDQYGNDAICGLSMSYTMEDPGTCLGYKSIRKTKVDQVKGSEIGMHVPAGHGYGEDNSTMTRDQTYNRGNENCFISIGQTYEKEDGSVGHTYNRGPSSIRSIDSTYDKGDGNASSIDHTFSKGATNNISFGGFHDESDISSLSRPLGSYELLCTQSSVQTSETSVGKELDGLNASASVSASQVSKPRQESVPKIKTEKKEAPNSFPSNVRSLISTGMFDGVPVNYVSLSQQKLPGFIKGSGYLCGCQSCAYKKVVNAYEFERHAGCKTKHPNNHIYFENGKTIYSIVQELRSTPEGLLFDTIQTITGSPINQKSFRIWKESFQAATRELQRIYGKEEVNQ